MLVVNKTLDSSTEDIIFKTIDLYKNLTLEEFSLLTEDIHLILDSPYKVNFIRTCSGDSYFKDNEYFLNVSNSFRTSGGKDKIAPPGCVFGGIFICKKNKELQKEEVCKREISFKLAGILLDFLIEKGLDRRILHVNGFGELFIQNKKVLGIDNVVKTFYLNKIKFNVYITFYTLYCDNSRKSLYEKEINQLARYHQYAFIQDFIPNLNLLEIKNLLAELLDSNDFY